MLTIIFVLNNDCENNCSYCYDSAFYPYSKDCKYTINDVSTLLNKFNNYEINVVIQGGNIFKDRGFLINLTKLFYDRQIPITFFLDTYTMEDLYYHPILFKSAKKISCNGPRYLHDLTRKRKDKKSSFDSIQHLLALHDENTTFVCTITERLVPHIKEIQKFFQEKRLKYNIQFDRRPNAFSKDSLDKISKTPIFTIQKTPDFYNRSYKRIFVAATGEIFNFQEEFLPTFEFKKIGNIKEDKEIPIITEKNCGHSCGICESKCLKYSELDAAIYSAPTLPPTSEYNPKIKTMYQHIFYRPGSSEPISLDEQFSELLIGFSPEYRYPSLYKKGGVIS